jgi:hypothetical protein
MHVPGVQAAVPHPFGPAPPHVWPAGHVPQFTVPPQPSRIVPHVAPIWLHVAGTHPQRFGPPPPQT